MVPYYNNGRKYLFQNRTNRLASCPQIIFLAVNKKYFKMVFRLKEEIYSCVRPSVIYKFTCGDCHSSYLACTQPRIHQHLGTPERLGLTLTNPSHFEPRNHKKKFKHDLSANKFRMSALTLLPIKIS